jgi:hypothetical protein
MTYRDPDRLNTVVYLKTKEGWKIVEGKEFQSHIPTNRLDENGDPINIRSNEVWNYGEGKYRVQHPSGEGFLTMQGGTPIEER